MARFWTSDLHLGHARIAEFCPGRKALGQTREEQDAMLITRFNLVTTPEDEIWFLGDIALGAIAESLPMVEQIHAKKFLVPGNHDRCWIGDKRHMKWMDRYREVGFTILPEQTRTTIAGFGVNVCHFPYEGDSHGEDRHAAYRFHDDGVTPVIHGHVHDAFQTNGRQFNVGVDANAYLPVHEAALEEWVRTL